MTENEITSEIIAAAIEVHRHLGPGLLENTYKKCLLHELKLKGLVVKEEVKIPLAYKGIKLDSGFRMDLLVADSIVVEIESIAEINDVHVAQTLTYLRIAKHHIGLLINFNVPLLREGIRRIVNGY